MVDIDLNTTAASQTYKVLAQLMSFIKMQELENSAVLSYNHCKGQKQSSAFLHSTLSELFLFILIRAGACGTVQAKLIFIHNKT